MLLLKQLQFIAIAIYSIIVLKVPLND